MFKVLALNIFLLLHPVHVTVTTINQAHDSDTLKVTCRIYIDDFRLDYGQYYPDFKPGLNNNTANYPDEMLNKYFNDRVRIYINNRLLPGDLTDISINRYEILVTLTYLSFKNPRTLKVSNRILTSIYSDQANMVYVNICGYEDALKLAVDDAEGTIKLR